MDLEVEFAPLPGLGQLTSLEVRGDELYGEFLINESFVETHAPLAVSLDRHTSKLVAVTVTKSPTVEGARLL